LSNAPLARRLAWFVALWSGSVLLTFSVAQLLRWIIAELGLHPK
jgi:hypothetical protein